ncbi:hypothetical protein AMELA_G00160000 [Ameiurus melas]|uniref:Uncharacterized protein n=1 Tax=Ameiurus melas TaxID=219545 RepID=A0A7J6AFB7_AMEME|nr:hypothetical protein AMELA_G00160000 [Ameiurus melas]
MKEPNRHVCVSANIVWVCADDNLSIRVDLVSRLQRAAQGVVRWQSGARGRLEAGKRRHRAELRKHEHCHTDRKNQATAFPEHCINKGQ